MLSSHLPEKLKILVKEHPDTFNLSREAWIRGMFNRSFDFYSDLNHTKFTNNSDEYRYERSY